MSQKQTKYQSSKGESDGMEDLEKLAQKLSIDLRKNIRIMGNHEIMSTAWLEMSETFNRLASVSDMELNIAPSKENSTLWETEEQAIRYLIEDGKLNLCLRIMIEYKDYQLHKLFKLFQKELHNATEETTKLVTIGDKFERNLGIVLKNAWLHVEAMQTTDISALIRYINSLFSNVIDYPEMVHFFRNYGNQDIAWRQEIFCFQYIKCLLSKINDYPEGRFMPEIREIGLFMNAVKFLAQIESFIPDKTHVFVGLEAISMLVDTEDFETYKTMYMPESEDVSILIKFKEVTMAPFLTDPAKKKLLRPLIDCIDKVKRLNKLK